MVVQAETRDRLGDIAPTSFGYRVQIARFSLRKEDENVCRAGQRTRHFAGTLRGPEQVDSTVSAGPDDFSEDWW